MKQQHSALKKAALQYLRLNKWFTFPIEQGPFSYKGIADIYATNGVIDIWIEIKIGKDKQSKWQQQFQKDIEDAHGNYLIIRSIDELIDKI